MHCDPEGDDRTPSNGKQANLNPGKHCTVKPQLPYSKREIQILYYAYNRDANELAAALCSRNAKTYERAAADMEEIGHTKNSITDWLGSDTTIYRGLAYPVVLEKPHDFDAQVDEAIRWGHKKTRFEDGDAFAERSAAMRAKHCLSSRKLAAKVGARSGHSSSQSSAKKHLSESNEACVARYFFSDYKILAEVQDTLCQSDTCRDAIQSILDRRAPSLGATKSADGKWHF